MASTLRCAVGAVRLPMSIKERKLNSLIQEELHQAHGFMRYLGWEGGQEACYTPLMSSLRKRGVLSVTLAKAIMWWAANRASIGWPPGTAPTWTWRDGQWGWIRRIKMLAKSFCKTSRRRMGRIWDAAVAPGVFGSKHAVPVRRGGGMSPSMSIAVNKLRSMLCPVAVLPISQEEFI